MNFRLKSTCLQRIVLIVVICLVKSCVCVNPAELFALGRTAQLGSLYDARTQTFLPISLRRPQESNHIRIQTRYIERTMIHFSTENSYKKVQSLQDKLSVLNGNPELSVSITCKEIQVGAGVFEFLRYKDLIQDHISDYYIWFKMIQSTRERWKIESPGVEDEIDFNPMRSHQPTHVVTEITYGGGIAARFTTFSSSSSSVPENVSHFESLQIYTDFSIGNQSQSNFNEVKDLMKKLPTLIGDKGIAMTYTLIPIHDFMEHFPEADLTDQIPGNSFSEPRPDFSKYVANIIDSSIFRHINLVFNQISLTGREIEEFRVKLFNHEKCVLKEDLLRIEKLRDDFYESSINLIENVKTLLTQVRSGSKNQTDLVDVLNDYKENDEYSYVSAQQETLTNFLGSRKKIQFYDMTRSQNIEYLGSGDFFVQISQSVGQSKRTYLLFIKNIFLIQDSQLWHETSAKFFTLGQNPENKLWVIDCDFSFPTCTNLVQPIIQEYHLGQLTSPRFNGTIGWAKNDKLELEEQIKSLRLEVEEKSIQIIQTLVSPPIARFYIQLNLTGGQYEDYNIIGDYRTGCQNLNVSLARKVMSLETFGTCVRVFSELNCQGPTNPFCSLNKTFRFDVSSYSDKFVSVGPCFESNSRSRIGSEIPSLLVTTTIPTLAPAPTTEVTTTTARTTTTTRTLGPNVGPNAVLYSRPNFSEEGMYEEYNMDSNENDPGCKDLDMNGKVRSIKTFGTCVQVYEARNCSGRGVTIHSNQNSMGARKINSVGPCE